MINMPLIIAAGVGGLFILLLVLFIVNQKKQDKKDTESTRQMLEQLNIDLKDASDDIDEVLETQTDRIPDPTDAKVKTPEAPPVKPPVDKSPQEEPMVIELIEPIKEEPGSFQTVASPESGDSGFEMIGNQDELMLEFDDQQPFSSDAIPVQEVPVSPSDTSEKSRRGNQPKRAAPEDVSAVPATADSDMSELDALFEASSDVEDMVISGQKATMFDPDASFDEDKPEGDLLEIDFEEIAVEPKSAPAEPARAAVVTPPPVKPAKPADSGVREPPPLDAEDQARHEKAKRIARVIVNDIRNYNPDNLAEGIRIGSIMKTLGKEIERGRLLYIKRVPADIAKETNYYRDALVKILADGQPELLGF